MLSRLLSGQQKRQKTSVKLIEFLFHIISIRLQFTNSCLTFGQYVNRKSFTLIHVNHNSMFNMRCNKHLCDRFMVFASRATDTTIFVLYRWWKKIYIRFSQSNATPFLIININENCRFMANRQHFIAHFKLNHFMTVGICFTRQTFSKVVYTTFLRILCVFFVRIKLLNPIESYSKYLVKNSSFSSLK